MYFVREEGAYLGRFIVLLRCRGRFIDYLIDVGGKKWKYLGSSNSPICGFDVCGRQCERGRFLPDEAQHKAGAAQGRRRKASRNRLTAGGHTPLFFPFWGLCLTLANPEAMSTQLPLSSVLPLAVQSRLGAAPLLPAPAGHQPPLTVPHWP